MKSLARSYTEAAIQTLGGIASNSDSDGARVNACAILLDRGWGKAEQTHSATVDGELKIIIRQITAEKKT